jgi:hypothetical protein
VGECRTRCRRWRGRVQAPVEKSPRGFASQLGCFGALSVPGPRTDDASISCTTHRARVCPTSRQPACKQHTHALAPVHARGTQRLPYPRFALLEWTPCCYIDSRYHFFSGCDARRLLSLISAIDYRYVLMSAIRYRYRLDLLPVLSVSAFISVSDLRCNVGCCRFCRVFAFDGVLCCR